MLHNASMNMASSIQFLLLLSCCLTLVATRPHYLSNRDRRSGISDQRLAELETLMALSRLRGQNKGMTRPIAFGLIDPNRIGRRKRAVYDYEEPLSGKDILSLPEVLQEDEDINEEKEASLERPSFKFQPKKTPFSYVSRNGVRLPCPCIWSSENSKSI